LLNEIIAAGGTTALTNKVTRKEIAEWLDLPQGQSTWHVAQTADGEILGFQWIGDWEDLPPEACEIGTFVKIGKTGLGVGSKMFAATQKAARAMGYSWIRAEIRADNEGGLAYYQSRGFEDFGRKDSVTLDDGSHVSKVLKRYDL